MNFKTPNILQCMRFIASAGGQHTRLVKDYEFDLYAGGERDIYIDHIYYHITKGALVFRRPGQVITGTADYNMYMLTVDFSGKNTIPANKYYRSSNTPEQEKTAIELIENMPNVFYPRHFDELVSLYEKMIKCSHPNIVDKELQDSYITEFLLLLLSESVRFMRNNEEVNKSKDGHIERACNYINSNYDKDLTVEGIAEYLCLNKNYFIRIFKEKLNITPNKYILESRLFYAKNLLLQSKQSVHEIGELCGFKTPSYFIKCFRSKFSMSPLAYRNKYNDSEA